VLLHDAPVGAHRLGELAEALPQQRSGEDVRRIAEVRRSARNEVRAGQRRQLVLHAVARGEADDSQRVEEDSRASSRAGDLRCHGICRQRCLGERGEDAEVNRGLEDRGRLVGLHHLDDRGGVERVGCGHDRPPWWDPHHTALAA